MMKKTVCELFAGVGGFRLGLERLNSGWETMWFSQWEPGARTQWAHDCYVKHFGESPDLNDEYHTGEDIGKSEHKVKQEVSYAMVSIYEDLQLYDKAYDFLVEQAIGYSWIQLHTVQNIVKKVGYCSRLKSAVCERLEKNDLSTDDRKDFEETKNWIMFDFEL